MDMATHATTSTDGDNSANSQQQQKQEEVPDIEDFHRVHEESMSRAERTYIDPETGYTVFTELIHLKRGKCCGNRCRHCPYGFEKVKPPGGYRKGSRRSRRANSKLDPNVPPPPPPQIPGAPVAKLRSGDTATAQKMVREILERAGKQVEENSGIIASRNRRKANGELHLEESNNDEDDDLSSTSSSSSSSYSSSSCSSVSTTESKDSNIQKHKPPSVIEAVKEAVTSSTSSAATTASATTTSATTNSSSNDGNSKPIPTTATTTTPTKNVPYTRTGDEGTSQLGNGERRSKTDDVFEAMGTVDELCSFVGVAHSHLLHSQKGRKSKKSYGELPVRLLDVMSRLFDVGSHVAKPTQGTFVPNGIGDGFDCDHVDDLEEWINEMTQDLPELTSFILPTGAPASAALHVARTVCRRAERRLVPLVTNHQTCDPNALQYLNRLSDFFFVSARWVNYKEGQEEIEYKLDIYDCEGSDDDSQGNHEDQRERVVRSLAEPNE